MLILQGARRSRGAVPAPLAPINRIMKWYGNSLTDEAFDFCPHFWNNGLNGAPLGLIKNAGRQGDFIAGMVARIDNDHTDSVAGFGGLDPTGFIWHRGLTNNARGSQPWSGVQSLVLQLFEDKFPNYGEQYFIFSVPPLEETLGQNNTVRSYNFELANYCAGHAANFTFVDDCINVRDAGGFQIPYFFLPDKVHFSKPGIHQMGEDGANALAARMASYGYPSPLVTDPLYVYPTVPQWHPNPTFIGAGGTKGSGFTGELANGMSISANPAGNTAHCSKVPADFGDTNTGDWQRFTIGAGTNGGLISITAPAVGPAITPDSPAQLESCLEMRTVALDTTNINCVEYYMQGMTTLEIMAQRVLLRMQGSGVISQRAILRQRQFRRAGKATQANANIVFRITSGGNYSTSPGSIDIRCASVETVA